MYPPNIDERKPILGSSKMQQHPVFEQHTDPDVIIPDATARPLVVSAHLFLAIAVLAACYGRYGLCAVLGFLYITSVWHWHKPRFSSWARVFDYTAVFSSIAYASYVASTLSMTLMLVWFCGLAFIAVIFTVNEYSYYVQVMKTFNGSVNVPVNSNMSGRVIEKDAEKEKASRSVDDQYKSFEAGCCETCCGMLKSVPYEDENMDTKYRLVCVLCDFAPTRANTPERQWVYERTARVHLICVHLIASALALTLIVDSGPVS